jgi:hypothetical protein
LYASEKSTSLPHYGNNYDRKKFYSTGANVIKLSTSASYAFSR